MSVAVALALAVVLQLLGDSRCVLGLRNNLIAILVAVPHCRIVLALLLLPVFASAGRLRSKGPVTKAVLKKVVVCIFCFLLLFVFVLFFVSIVFL